MRHNAQVMADAIDAQVEADIKVMQQVIVTGRAIRDRHNLGARTPLPEVTLVHQKDAALSAVKRTQAYIQEELNVRTVKAALVDSVRDIVRFKCLPNLPLLGKRFGKECKKVTDEIKALDHSQLAAFMESGEITIGANKFTREDLLVSLEYSGDKTQRDAEIIEGGGLVLLDTKPDGGMLDEATAREVCSKIQKMRKDATLKKSDEVDVFYSAVVDVSDGSGSTSALANVLAEQREYVSTRIGRPIFPMALKPSLAVPIIEEDKEITVQRIGPKGEITKSNEALKLSLCRACVYFDEKKLSKAIPDAAVRESAKTFVHYKDLSALRQEMSGGNGTLAFTIDKVAVSLKYGEHFFLGSNEAAKAGVL